MYTTLVVTPVILQALFYILRCLFDWRIPQFRELDDATKIGTISRINGILVISCLTSSCLFITSPEEILQVNQMFAGYLLYDLRYAGTASMTIHHLACLVVCYFANLSQPFELYEFYRIMVCLESSVIPLSVTWLFHTFHYPMNLCHRMTRLFAYVSWSTLRMGIFPYLMYYSQSLTVQYTLSPVIILNTYWFYLLTKMIFSKKSIRN